MDILLVSRPLSKTIVVLKQVGKPIVVVNKAGGTGTRGYSVLAASKPDG